MFGLIYKLPGLRKSPFANQSPLIMCPAFITIMSPWRPWAKANKSIFLVSGQLVASEWFGKGWEVELIAWFHCEGKSKQRASEMFTLLLRFIWYLFFRFQLVAVYFCLAETWVSQLSISLWRHSGVLAMLIMLLALCPILNANSHTAHDPKWGTLLPSLTRIFSFSFFFFDRGPRLRYMTFTTYYYAKDTLWSLFSVCIAPHPTSAFLSHMLQNLLRRWEICIYSWHK